MTAFNDLDAPKLRALLAPGATAFLPFAATGARLNGRDEIMKTIEPMFAAERARHPAGPPYLHLTARDLQIQRISPATAVLSFDVGNENVHSRRTLVLRLDQGRWTIAHLHASNVRPDTR